jgi:preprotein translocase subunit SecG
MFTLCLVLYIVVCLFLMMIVLLQQGRGADLAGAFGGGSQQTFGPRGGATFLHKLTTVLFIAFVVLAVLLAVFEAKPRSSVIKDSPKNPRASAPAKTPPAPVPAKK